MEDGDGGDALPFLLVGVLETTMEDLTRGLFEERDAASRGSSTFFSAFNDDPFVPDAAPSRFRSAGEGTGGVRVRAGVAFGVVFREWADDDRRTTRKTAFCFISILRRLSMSP